MGIRCSLNLPLFSLVTLMMLAGFLLLSGESSADPEKADNSAACPASSCGTVCWYANCVHCSRGSTTETCRRCQPQRIPGVETCTTREVEVIDPDTGMTNIETIETCRTSPDSWTTCPALNTLSIDHHGDYWTDENYELPTAPHPGGACAAAENPYNTEVTYYFDLPNCERWAWHMVGPEGDGTSFSSSGSESASLNMALSAGAQALSSYDCRDLTPSLPASTPPVTPGRTALIEVEFNGGASISYHILDLGAKEFSEPLGVMPAIPPDDGASIRLNSVTEVDYPVYRLDVSGAGGGELLYRVGTFNGRQLSNEFETLPTSGAGAYRHTFPTAPAVPYDTIGMYSFQVALVVEGEIQRSNLVHKYVGFIEDLGTLPESPVLPPLTYYDDVGVAVGKDPSGSPFDAVPTATLLPLRDADGEIVSRPVSPVIADARATGEAWGEAVVQVGAYNGLLEYRYWSYNGFRPAERKVEWESVVLPDGEGRYEFRVSGLDVPQFYVFEVRAVAGTLSSGIRGDASPVLIRLIDIPSPTVAKPWPTPLPYPRPWYTPPPLPTVAWSLEDLLREYRQGQ